MRNVKCALVNRLGRDAVGDCFMFGEVSLGCSYRRALAAPNFNATATSRVSLTQINTRDACSHHLTEVLHRFEREGERYIYHTRGGFRSRIRQCSYRIPCEFNESQIVSKLNFATAWSSCMRGGIGPFTEQRKKFLYVLWLRH